MHVHLVNALRAVDDAAGHLPVDVIGRPVPGRWSIGDILEHLTLAFTLNAEAFEKGLASGTLKVRRSTIPQRIGRLLVIELGLFPKVQSPELTRPRGTIGPDRSVAALREALVHLDAVMDRTTERFGERTPSANHPYFGGLSVRDWRKFHWRHTVHHMRQVRARAAQD